MPAPPPAADPSPARWELGVERIAVQIRWLGLVFGTLYAHLGSTADPYRLTAVLALGLAFTALDTVSYWRGRILLGGQPLVISALEAVYIGLLCYVDAGGDSPFRFYYILSVVCAAIRYPPGVTALTCLFDVLSYAALSLAVPESRRDGLSLGLMPVVLGWVAWATTALARLLKRVGAELATVNAELERRIADRTRELQESQAQVLHQEKMAAFGLLAAGIAHEVGNPLASISTLVQMLERRDPDDYTRERLGLVNAQLTRIQHTLRELVAFSRPASDTRGRVRLKDVVDEALGIAKYYKGGKGRQVRSEVPPDLPPLDGVRDQLVQVFFNLVINAIDATGRGGHVTITAAAEGGRVVAAVADDGHGIDPAHRDRLFGPYFTTKRHGTGLGLFVCRQLVRAHGGSIDVESAPGAGTTFRLAFPLPPGGPPAAAG